MVGELIAANDLDQDVQPVRVLGQKEPYYMLSANFGLLESDELREAPTYCTLLSPFDNLIWHRDRMKTLFGVDYKLKCYKPSAARIYGYFALPMLIRGDIVGTMDLKMDRNKRELIIKKMHVFNAADESRLNADIAAILVKLIRFLQAERIVCESPGGHQVLVKKVQDMML